MEILDHFRCQIEQELREVLGMAGTHGGVDVMLGYHMGFCNPEGTTAELPKGKYLRPALSLAMCSALGGVAGHALGAAASIELAHRASLIFDDIQDQGKERNRRPTVWALWGPAQAINGGLALSCFARLALHRMRDVPEGVVLAVHNVLERAVIDLCQGQYRDILATMEREERGKTARKVRESCGELLTMERESCAKSAGEISLRAPGKMPVADCIEMIRGKTAALFRASCEVGALCAPGAWRSVDLAREFGENLGVAFQVHDDLLGIWGDEVEVGKTANDLMEKKLSLPVALALEADPEQVQAWPDGEITREDAAIIRSWMESQGIPERVRDLELQYGLAAKERLDALPLLPEWRGRLNGLLEFVTARKL